MRPRAQADKLILEQRKVTSSIGLIQVGGRKGGEEGDVAKFGQECGRERSSLLMFLGFHC